MTTDSATTDRVTISRERADLLETLAKHRYFLRYTVRDLTDEQARLRTTASELSLGGLIKHVTATEASWLDFIETGSQGEPDYEAWLNGFQLTEDETLSQTLERYEEVNRRTDRIVRELPDLDVDFALPEAPWFEPGARWSARRVLLHIIAETAQHAGHADIIRESLDGSKSMG